MSCRPRDRRPATTPAGAVYPTWCKLAPLGSLLLPLLAHGDASLPQRSDDRKPRKVLVLPEIVVEGRASGTTQAGQVKPQSRPRPEEPIHLGGVAPMPEPPAPPVPPKKVEPKKSPPPSGVKTTTLLHPHAADQPCFPPGERLFSLRLV